VDLRWWTIDGGGARDLIARTGIGHGGAMLFAAFWLVAAIVWARRQKVSFWGWAGAVGVGLSVVAGWWFTYAVSRLAFDAHPIQSLSFTGPSAEILSRVLFVTDKPLSFDAGLMPGVFLGSFLSAALFRELKLEGFEGGPGMRRYIVGAVLMGFGGMLAGGCAVGAGLSGAAVFTATAWVTLGAMWAAAAITDRLLDHHPATRCRSPAASPCPASRWPPGVHPELRDVGAPAVRAGGGVADGHRGHRPGRPGRRRSSRCRCSRWPTASGSCRARRRWVRRPTATSSPTPASSSPTTAWW
jgi:uncharacterized membrane protein YedE/YeeE